MRSALFVDASNMFARAFFSHRLTTSSGMHSGMFFGCMKMLESKIRQHNITDVYVFLDSKPYWKKTVFPQYKQGRKGLGFQAGEFAEDYEEQKKDLSLLFPKLGFRVVSYPGFEADDLIAAYVCDDSLCFDEILMYSGDHDLYQLIGGRVKMIKAQTGDRDPLFGEKEVLEKTGVSPEAFASVLAIAGDKSDGVPSIFAKMDGTESEGYYWVDPPRIISATKVAKMLSHGNTVENLLSGKVTPVKGIGRSTENLFLRIGKREIENYERNVKLVNLRSSGNNFLRTIRENSAFLREECSEHSSSMLLQMLKKYECESVKTFDEFPYFYVHDKNSSNKPKINRNAFLSLLKRG